jgi:hypothetical protein
MKSDPHMKARNQRKLLMNNRRQESTDCLIWNGQISNGEIRPADDEDSRR